MSIQIENVDFFNLSENEAMKKLNTNMEKGLTNEEAQKRLQEFSANELEKEQKESIFEKIKEQFEDYLVRILLLAAVISFTISYFDDEDEHSLPPWVEPSVIIAILIINAFVGVWQDLDAEKALEALENLQSINTLVLREGKWDEISSKDLVPGDIVQVSPGDKVPADLRCLKFLTPVVKVDEAILTGETNPQTKTTEKLSLSTNSINADKKNILHSATLVSSGRAIGVVIGTGKSSALGEIQKQVIAAKEDTEDEETPLKQKINEFGEMLARAIAIICIIIWVINFKNFWDPTFGSPFKGALYYFKIAVALAVAAIPEGLPAVITTCLALGTRRMAKQRAIVRRLPSVETLGCTTVICSDKTGTLTTNEMSVKKLMMAKLSDTEFENLSVEGVSFSPEGRVNGLDYYLNGNQYSKSLEHFLNCSALCNDSKLIESEGRVTPAGLPTEAALKVLNEKICRQVKGNLSEIEGYNSQIVSKFTKLATLEFTSKRKSMSVLVEDNESKKRTLYVKGAPDYILKTATQIMTKDGNVVPLTNSGKKVIEEALTKNASEGFRCLLVCMKNEIGDLEKYTEHSHSKVLEDVDNYGLYEKDPIVLGLVAMQDPPRPEVKEAIEKCSKAGIKVVMVTGDIKETALSIGQDIGILEKGSKTQKCFTGAEFEQMKVEERKAILEKSLKDDSGLVFARVEPKHKRELVQTFSSLNQIVAMTGDGVNDAPALKQAHIGIAMGIVGTEVSKEASDMVLADDNFSTIVSAVEEGRAIYANMKAFIRYMISSNIGEVMSIFMSSLLGIPDGFNSIQLLWVNLVTDGLPATALSFNPPDPEVMRKPPRKTDEALINGWIFIRYMVIGIYVGLSTVGIFIYWYSFDNYSSDGHTIVSLSQLSSWGQCPAWENFSVNNFGGLEFANPCEYFTYGKRKASTLSLTVLVMIEMFNAVNALSEDSSILSMGIFANPFLLIAIAGSVILHCVILYIPIFQRIFSTMPLTAYDWALVIAFSFPVIIIDEILKFIARQKNKADMKKQQ